MEGSHYPPATPNASSPPRTPTRAPVHVGIRNAMGIEIANCPVRLPCDLDVGDAAALPVKAVAAGKCGVGVLERTSGGEG